MSETITIARRRKSDGKFVRVLPDGSEVEFPPRDRIPDLTEEEIVAAALTDPDNPPMTPEREARMKRVPQVKVMRRALRLTQEEFASRFGIPLGTLRDWEQGKSEPDQSARAYLRVIARIPDAVSAALAIKP